MSVGRRWRWMAALALAAGVARAGDARAAAGVHVALVPATQTVAPGASFDLEIDVTQAGAAFNGFDAYIGFDPGAAQAVPSSPVSLQEGSLMTSACGSQFHRFLYSNTTGRDTINDVLLCSGVSVTGPGQIYKLHFKAGTTQQTTTVRFLPGLQFYNEGLFVNPDSSMDAQVTIAAPTSTITAGAGAGAGGTITPSGAVSVVNGSSQSFTIGPDGCHTIANVVVDGGSVGAVASYTFTNVQANHTIAASFALRSFGIAASAGAGGSIAPSGAVTVSCGASQSFTIAGDGCHAIADVQVDGGSVGPVSSYTFTNVTASHTIAASFLVFSFAITSSAGNGGSIDPLGTLAVECGGNQSFTLAPDACQHVADVVVDGSSVGAVTSYSFANVTADHTIAASFAANTTSLPAITDLATPGDPPIIGLVAKRPVARDATKSIRVTFTPPNGARSVEVWRKGFGNHPEYDDPPNAGSAPAVPASYPPAGWTLTGVTASEERDVPGTRDFWYYVAYAKDSCGNASPVSNLTTGALDYLLGDVTDGVTDGQGDGKMTLPDIQLLGARYGLAGNGLAGYEYLDVGPTSDASVHGRPLTDDRTDFEDLMITGLDYPSRDPGAAAVSQPRASTVNLVRLQKPAIINAGDHFDVTVILSASNSLQGISIQLGWNAAQVTPTGVTIGSLVSSQGGVMYSPAPGGADATLLGPGPGIAGEGPLAVFHFLALQSGDAGLDFDRVLGRSDVNGDVPIDIGVTTPVTPIVSATELRPVVPNPAVGRATLVYSLARRGRVDLAVFSVDGRRVATLAKGVQEAGRYEYNWSGADERGTAMGAGVYFVTLDAPGYRKTRLLTLVR